jgi:NAD(P)-dependent dehydrogenase (short-subunit alcohol dehydrogenase family)
MKFLITGGNRGLGKHLCDHFQGTSVSRNNGYDITDPNHRTLITEMSLAYDVFINNAFDGPFQETWADFGQTKLLWSVANSWQTCGKQGYIINIGSVGTERVTAPDPAWETYRISKAALKEHSRQWSQAFKENKVPFRTSLLTLDRLDTELSRSRGNWTGNGIAMQDVCAYIELLLASQANTCIEEITSWVNYDHKQNE